MEQYAIVEAFAHQSQKIVAVLRRFVVQNYTNRALGRLQQHLMPVIVLSM